MSIRDRFLWAAVKVSWGTALAAFALLWADAHQTVRF